ncbi:MAG: glycosyltransferase family 2 protein [Planctomycetaceae bacterium]|nr:glycosyltransferase family 2 protein [Planctomycetaceae bacterium]
MKTDLSLIVCLYFEEDCVTEFVRQVQSVLAGGTIHWELVFVDDGSQDGTVRIVKELAAEDSRIRLVVLSRNYGKEAAITAGVAHANGEFMILMDPDLQDPPHRIVDFYNKANEGYDLVWGIRKQQSRGIGERIFSSIFWKVLRSFTGPPTEK